MTLTSSPSAQKDLPAPFNADPVTCKDLQTGFWDHPLGLPKPSGPPCACATCNTRVCGLRLISGGGGFGGGGGGVSPPSVGPQIGAEPCGGGGGGRWGAVLGSASLGRLNHKQAPTQISDMHVSLE